MAYIRLHFISGLPRSGSTLFAAILRQNPRFYSTGMSSPLAQIMMKVQQAISRGSEGAVFIDEDRRKHLLQGLFHSYYSNVTSDIVFDTNRTWCSKMSLISELFPESKVICMVRNIPWVMNSVEKLIQSNSLELSGIFNFMPATTVFTRAESLASSDGMVGHSLNSLAEAYYGKFSDRLILLDYEALCKFPKQSFEYIYDFLKEPYFEHDFDNFEYEAEAFDAGLGTPGLHKVKGPVKWEEQKMILPPGLASRFVNDSFWRNQNLNINGVPVIMVTNKEEEKEWLHKT